MQILLRRGVLTLQTERSAKEEENLIEKGQKVMSEFLPKDEPGLADWFENWATKMDDHGAEHGFSAAEILQAKDDAMIVRNIVSGGQAIRAYRMDEG